MKRRTFEEMVIYFNQTVADMDIPRKYKMELLGMITAILQKHDEEVRCWIPVTERLPEKKQEVIVTVTRKNGSTFTERDGWTGTGFWGFGHRVIAWMPMPAPYTEETNA